MLQNVVDVADADVTDVVVTNASHVDSVLRRFYSVIAVV